MKKYFINITTLFILIFILCNCRNDNKNADKQWESVNQILKNISEPKFPNRVFNVVDFGALADSNFDSRSAIQKTIDECSEAGGGKVLIPEGIYFCAGSIYLKNNVNLHFEDSTTLNFSVNPEDYLPLVLARWEGVELYNYSALIYAKDQENIALTGKGILNGKASAQNWWPWKGKIEYGFLKGMHSQLDSLNRPRLLAMNNNETPVAERIFGEGHYLRPNFFQIINCNNILIEDVTFIDSPMWFIHPVTSQNITIRGVKVIGKGPNNDGCNPESCKNVLIENCFFDTGDDCIAIKSGRNSDGRRIGIPSENISY